MQVFILWVANPSMPGDWPELGECFCFSSRKGLDDFLAQGVPEHLPINKDDWRNIDGEKPDSPLNVGPASPYNCLCYQEDLDNEETYGPPEVAARVRVEELRA